MKELVSLVQEKTGLPEAKAKQAVQVMVDFMKQKLPAPVAGQVEAALQNEDVISQADGLLDEGINRLGGLLGKKKG